MSKTINISFVGDDGQIWYADGYVDYQLKEKDKEIERLNNIINKAIEFIEKYQIERKVKIGNVELDKSFVNSQGLLEILVGDDNDNT